MFDGRAGAGRLLPPSKLWGGDKVTASGVPCFTLFDGKSVRGGGKKKLFLKIQHPRRARPYFLIPMVNHPVISPSVLLSRKSKEGRREGNAIQFVMLADSVNTSIFSSLKFTLILLTEVCSAVFGFHF